MADQLLTITPGGIPDGPRRRTQASTRLLHEWSIMQPWDAPPIYELRICPTTLRTYNEVLTPAVEAMLRVFNRYADMVGITPTEIQVIESKVVLDPGAIGQLEYYLDLMPGTPLVREWPGRRIQGVLLAAVDDPIIHQRATARGIRVNIFTPPWVNDYLQTKYFRR